MNCDSHFILLTHSRELLRKTNTGKLVVGVLPNCVEQIIWHRTEPNRRLCELLVLDDTVLIYPQSELLPDKLAKTNVEQLHYQNTVADFRHFVLIDSTWQEARKIVNQSPYLKAAKKLNLEVGMESRYQMRRNQKEGGLSTLESVAFICREKQHTEAADALEEALIRQMMLYQRGEL